MDDWPKWANNVYLGIMGGLSLLACVVVFWAVLTAGGLLTNVGGLAQLGRIGLVIAVPVTVAFAVISAQFPVERFVSLVVWQFRKQRDLGEAGVFWSVRPDQWFGEAEMLPDFKTPVTVRCKVLDDSQIDFVNIVIHRTRNENTYYRKLFADIVATWSRAPKAGNTRATEPEVSIENVTFSRLLIRQDTYLLEFVDLRRPNASTMLLFDDDGTMIEDNDY